MPVYPMYRFDSLGRFVEEDTIFSDSPVDLSRFTPPKGHTFVPPPATKEGEVAVWGDGAWRVAQADEFEPPQPTLDELKKAKEDEMDYLWGVKMAEGFESSTGYKVKCESLDISMWQKALGKASKKGVLPLMRDFNGDLHRNVPLGVVATIYNELDAYMEELWEHKVLLQEMIRNASSIEELEAISWETPTPTQ